MNLSPWRELIEIECGPSDYTPVDLVRERSDVGRMQRAKVLAAFHGHPSYVARVACSDGLPPLLRPGRSAPDEVPVEHASAGGSWTSPTSGADELVARREARWGLI
jgi:hypothetical protein